MTYISDNLRNQIKGRASNKCEYCLLDERYSGAKHQVDHIIAQKHGGSSDKANLCYACFLCNSYKGTDIASIDWDDDEQLVPLFHPRKQKWQAHFEVDSGLIKPLTNVGRVTVFLLRLNDLDRLDIRKRLYKLKRYP